MSLNSSPLFLQKSVQTSVLADKMLVPQSNVSSLFLNVFFGKHVHILDGKRMPRLCCTWHFLTSGKRLPDPCPWGMTA